MRKIQILILFVLVLTIAAGCTKPTGQDNYKKGNVVFIHPDGTSLSNYNATRILYYGPDSTMNWDRIPNSAFYRGHTKNSLTSSSHAGATMHSYGVKVVRDSYGMDGKEELTARSGKKMSIMQEAMKSGIQTGIINSGDVVEPGTGVFVASDTSRGNREEIARKVIQSGADLIFVGGERLMLPEGIEGKHGQEGIRKDGLNLIKWAEEKGYHILYTKEDLKTIPDDAEKLLGVFAADDTYNDKSEEELKELGLQNYNPDAPTLAEMTQAALDFFSRKKERFFLVVEEEGTDNFGNYNNASGMLEALKRADDAMGITLDFIKKNPNTMLITAADSEAGGMEVMGLPEDRMNPNENLPERGPNGAPIDGREGTGTKPFIAKPDKNGKRFAFEVQWSTGYDVYGAVIAKAAGLNSEYVKGSIQNTDIYKYMYLTLFGKMLK